MISIEFGDRGDAISGRLRDGEVEVGFTGWLGLAAALEASWRRHSASAPEGPGSGTVEKE